MDVLYTTGAQDFLDRQHDDPTLAARLDETLAAFEADPTNGRWRVRGYSAVAGRAYAFDVRGRSDEVMVLWQQVTPAPVEGATPSDAPREDVVLVAYIGPPELNR
jgi:hypothetical protein